MELKIEDRLAALGNGIGLLKAEERGQCGDLLQQYVDCNGEERTEFVEASLEGIMKDYRFVRLSIGNISIVFIQHMTS